MSGFPISPLDSVPFQDSIVISGFLVDLWISYCKTPACPMTGRWWSDDEIAQIIATTPKGPLRTLTILNEFEKPDDARAWTAEQVSILRLNFWTYCLNELLKETLSDELCMQELNYLTRLLLHGAIYECPTLTMTNMVTLYEGLRFVDDPSHVHDSFYVESYTLRNQVRTIMHLLMTSTKQDVLTRLAQDQGLGPLGDIHANVVHTLLLASYQQDIFEFLGF